MVTKVLSRIPRVRVFLDHWQLWVLVAYFGLAAVTVTLVVLFGRLSKEEAERAAISRANDAARVSQCYASAKSYPDVKGFIDAHQAIVDNSIIATSAALLVTPRSSPFYQIRKQSLIRLRRARDNSEALRLLIVQSRRTPKACRHLAHELKVPVPPPERAP